MPFVTVSVIGYLISQFKPRSGASGPVKQSAVYWQSSCLLSHDSSRSKSMTIRDAGTSVGQGGDRKKLRAMQTS